MRKASMQGMARMGAALLTTIFSVASSAAERPNIVFIFSDDHAVRAVSAYGDSLVETPNIDRIAAGGMRFDRAYVGNAICGPSRATLLTGLHSHANGFYSNEWSGPFDGEQQTLSSLLQTAGYQTAVIGKWHLYSDPVGFDHWEVIDNVMEQGTYYNPSFRSPAGIEEATGYVADLVTDKSIAWLKAAQREGSPFFLLYNHKTPHRDWMPGPEELRNWDEDARFEEPETLLRNLDGQTRARREARMRIEDYMTDGDVKLSKTFNLTPEQEALWEQAFAEGNRQYEDADLSADEALRWKYQRYIKTYAASVQSMDRQIGRLLDYLESNGLMDNTIVLYSSDQGFFLGENGWFDKRWMDEVSSQVPLLVQWQGHIPPGTASDALVQNIDFAPTLLAAASVKPDKPMHGVSLLPLFEDDPKPWQRDLYYHFYENPGFHGVARHYGVRTERYKLVYYYQNDEWELFDLVTDPDDQVNLYGKPDYDDVTGDLKQRLAKLREQYQVPESDPEVPWYHGPFIRGVEQLMKWL
ncbi:Multifunctional alkaline phosphatase superfamily protein [Halioglobus japonicus]|nr:Multifunctional alkaline phosphatase superfamily protein [Halioglobus japonicus]